MNGLHCNPFDQTKYWFKDSMLHNKNGPAIIYPDGRKCWYLNDIKYTYVEWYIETHPQMTKTDKVKLILKKG